MRILFAGSPYIAVPSLQSIASQFTVAGVLTAPDKISGRGRRLTPPAVKIAAEELGLSILQPARVNEEARNTILKLKPDLLVVFAYGRIFGPKFLNIFPMGGINMHPSALPQFRGPSPLTAAILAGNDETALTVQRLALKLDSGDILRQTPLRLSPSETTGSLEEKVARQAGDELLTVLKSIQSSTVEGYAQNHESATYCHLVTRDSGRIDWKQNAVDIERMVRAYYPWPKARTKFADRSLAILESNVVIAGGRDDSPIPGTVLSVDKSHGILVQTGNGILGVTRLQAESRKPMGFEAFLNGVRNKTGMLWGDGNEKY